MKATKSSAAKVAATRARAGTATARTTAKSPAKSAPKGGGGKPVTATRPKNTPTTPARSAPNSAAKPANRAANRAAQTAAPAAISVPKGTEWTKAELAAIRAQLVAQFDDMRAAYDTSLRDLTDLQSSSTDGAGDDQADAGSKTFEREQEQSIAANRMDLISQIQRAVERIDAGTYGFCESCGKPIPKARLKAFPMATLDVACKQREERR